ncbi:MAG: methylcobamide--CoM methyltransferase, partial [Clostridia bacterium]|nr:methylcobamide--CoM methyltransferase [Clostridia bacterium]
DSDRVIEDWDAELEAFLADFPSPEYPGLIPACPPEDGRYRIGTWWYFFFERLWSIRGMENALMDFYLYPDEIHALFRRLADFYKRMITRAHEALRLDAIMTSDDLGAQTSTFFSPGVFDEFFAPYYREVIDHIHSLGMHFWLHTCGNVKALMPKFIELGVDVQHPIQKYTMDEAEIAREFGGRMTIWAGFDVQRTIPFGTPEDVRREARFLIDTWARPDGRFLFTLGNGATSDTPLPSLEALFDEVFTYGSEKIAQING